MLTIQGIMMKTEAMMEQIRINAIEYTYEKFKAAARRYYTQGYDNGESVALIKELEELGANMEVVFDTDLSIRDEVEAEAEG